VAGSLDTIVDDGRSRRAGESRAGDEEPGEDSMMAALTPAAETEKPVPAAAE
jgi:hypothetical protein